MKNRTDLNHLESKNQAAYSGKTLGLPKYAPAENIDKIDHSVLRDYTKQFYRPDRMVLAGVGIDHDRLLELGRKYFSTPKPTNSPIVEEEKAVWKGGFVLVRKLFSPFMETLHRHLFCLFQEERDLSHLSFGADPLPELAHVALGFEGIHKNINFLMSLLLRICRSLLF